MAKSYPEDYSIAELKALDDQLDSYILDMHSSEQKSIGDLAQKIVETRRNIVYSLIYRLVTLSLILFVVVVSIERVFLTMNVVKNQLQ